MAITSHNLTSLRKIKAPFVVFERLTHASASHPIVAQYLPYSMVNFL